MKLKSLSMLIVAGFLCTAISFAVATNAVADSPVIKGGDTISTVLEKYLDKRVTVRLQGGEELTGKVKFISKELLQLSELTKREYFDAVIEVSRIEAIIVRTKE